MRKVSEIEPNRLIDVKLFITNLCPQCVIAIGRIDKISSEFPNLNVNVINITSGTTDSKIYERLTPTPYYLINDKYVVPGTSSENYIRNILHTTIATR